MDILDNVFSAEGLCVSKKSQEDAGVVILAITGGVALAAIIGGIVASGIDRNKAKKLYEDNKDEILKEIKKSYTIYKEISKKFKEDFIKEFNKVINNPDILKCINFDVETTISDFIKETKYHTNKAKKNEGYCESHIELFEGDFLNFLEKYYYIDDYGFLSETGEFVVNDIFEKTKDIVKTINDKYKKEYEIDGIELSNSFIDESWEDFDCYLNFTMDWTFLLKK